MSPRTQARPSAGPFFLPSSHRRNRLQTDISDPQPWRSDPFLNLVRVEFFPKGKQPPFLFHHLRVQFVAPFLAAGRPYLLQGGFTTFLQQEVTGAPDVIRGPTGWAMWRFSRVQPNFNLLCPGSIFFDFPVRFGDAAASFCVRMLRETPAVAAGWLTNAILTRSSSWMSLAKCQS